MRQTATKKPFSYHIDELMAAMRWLSRDCSIVQQVAINKSYKSLERLGIDGNHVIIAAYRMHARMMADTVPFEGRD